MLGGMCRLILPFALCLACGSDAYPSWPALDSLEPQDELPAALEMFDGRPVDSPQMWFDERRVELRSLFQHYVYGYMPPRSMTEGFRQAPPLGTEFVAHDPQISENIAYTEYELDLGPEGTPPIYLAIFRPRNLELGRVPVLLALNKCGNQSLHPSESIRVTESFRLSACSDEFGAAPVRGDRAESWPLEQIIARGYALATFHESDVDPDDGSDRLFEDGVHPHFQFDPPEGTRWGTIAAWAYGLSRAVDYLSDGTQPGYAAALDPSRIATVGHSRRGKAALLAAAFDTRIAMTIPHQSGTGGATLSRSYLGEPVSAVNTLFPHWFNDVFPEFADRETLLPIDQHLLIAMVAPRAVFVTNGAEDDWADPPGALAAVEAAAPVWPFLGAEGLVLDADGQPTLDGPLSWAIRPGEHSVLASDWTLFMDFADRHL